jgi:hypothetical protein
MGRRSVYWLFIVSMALFVSGVCFVVAGARATLTTPPPVAAAETPRSESTATVKQIMRAIVMPAAASIWDSVATTVSEQGTVETRPENDEAWATVAANAAVLAESANLLLDSHRAPDKGDWTTMARAMAETANLARKAAEAKNAEGILEVGDAINKTCDNCHGRYSRS